MSRDYQFVKSSKTFPINKTGHKIIDYINEHYDIRDLYEAVTGVVPGNGKIMCCMHPNHNTPAAKIYGNSLKCFGECNRLFNSYDLIKRFFPEEIEKVKSSLILPESANSTYKVRQRLSRKNIDLTQPIDKILTQIIELGSQGNA